MYVKCINSEGTKSVTEDKIYFLKAKDNLRFKIICDDGICRWMSKNRFKKISHNTKEHNKWRRQYRSEKRHIVN